MKIHRGITWTITLALTVSALAALESKEFRIEIDAGDHDRSETPVSFDIDLNSVSDQVASGQAISRLAVLLYADRIHYGQVEDLGGGRARVHWILDSLDAGSRKVFNVSVSSKVQPASGGFQWKGSSGDHGTSTDLLHGDRALLRYMHTAFDRDDIENTKKVFHQVFSPDGSRIITKGVGGLYPHHRGIYFGYNRVKILDSGKKCDIWHAKNGEHQLQEKVLRTIEGPVLGGHILKILWNDTAGSTFAEETRRIVVYRIGEDGMLVDFQTRLGALRGPISLAGDPQHAGVQLRAAQYVAEHQKDSRYLRPAAWKDLPEDKQFNHPGNPKHRDMPWNALRFGVPDADGNVQRYTVAYLSHPANPAESFSSERLYGRFGEYIPHELQPGKPLVLRYRWWIVKGDEASRADVQSRYDDLAHPPLVKILGGN